VILGKKSHETRFWGKDNFVKVLKLMIQKDHKIKGDNVLILGVTFKENCPDIWNSKVVDIKALKENRINVTIYDP
jgi:UDP-N-acetyl-D-galactosamine dehydrogenase